MDDTSLWAIGQHSHLLGHYGGRTPKQISECKMPRWQQQQNTPIEQKKKTTIDTSVTFYGQQIIV